MKNATHNFGLIDSLLVLIFIIKKELGIKRTSYL